MVDRYIAKDDIWHFSNIGIGRCVRGGTFILTALITAAPEHTALTFSLLHSANMHLYNLNKSLND